MCTSQLKSNYKDAIRKVEESFNILHHRFGCTIPNKVHIAVTHVPEYIAKTKLALGQTSDQVIEGTHQYTNKILMGSRYWVKDLDNPLQGENLLRGVNHINSYNTLTK